MGESADREVVRRLAEIAESDPGVERVRRLLTMHLAPDQVLLNMDLVFASGLAATDLPRVIERVEAALRREFPEIAQIFIEVEPFTRRRERGSGAEGDDRGE